MTRYDVIRMAKESGLLIPSFRIGSGLALGACTIPGFEHFAALVAAAEREACAKGCETSVAGFGTETEWAEGYVQAAKDIAEGIRARGEK